MSNSLQLAVSDQHSDHHSKDDAAIFGFWIYLMSDCILFSGLFATFAVLHTSTYGVVNLKELIDLPYVFKETLLLLSSSFTFGMGVIALVKKNKSLGLAWFCITFLLGAGFVSMEINEFIHLYSEGHGFQRSAALSSFFTLVGTHGLHVTIGLLWMVVLMFQLIYFGISKVVMSRFSYFGLFWAFLDIVWIFVFTIVYLMEAI